MNANDLPGIYRQTTETTGMYSPLKKHLHRAQQMIPSKNCASQKIIPSQAPLLPPPDYQHPLNGHQKPLELFKNSHSLPQLKNAPDRGVDLCDVHVDADRPYTPPEKRYNANFGKRAPTPVRRERPHSSCVYENAHARDDFCASLSKVKSDRGLNHTANVMVKNFPTPEFSRMYIQNSLDWLWHVDYDGVVGLLGAGACGGGMRLSRRFIANDSVRFV